MAAGGEQDPDLLIAFGHGVAIGAIQRGAVAVAEREDEIVEGERRAVADHRLGIGKRHLAALWPGVESELLQFAAGDRPVRAQAALEKGQRLGLDRMAVLLQGRLDQALERGLVVQVAGDGRRLVAALEDGA